jgi:hypothetical protein
MDLKELIKQLTREILAEEPSASSAVGGYLSKNFLNPGGKNKATKAAEKQGFTAIHENMSKEEALKQIRNLLSHTIKHDKLEGTFNSWFEKVKAEDDEILDKMWKLAGNAADKHAINVLSKINESGFDQPSKFQNAKYPYNNTYGGPSSATKGGGYYAANENMNKFDATLMAKDGLGKEKYDSIFKLGKQAAENGEKENPYARTHNTLSRQAWDDGFNSIKKENMNESLMNIIKEELLNEVTYNKFKNEIKFRTKNEQLHRAIREVKRKLSEIDRIVEYTSLMKQELSENEAGTTYWKATQKNVTTIAEMVNQLNNKIKNLQQ